VIRITEKIVRAWIRFNDRTSIFVHRDVAYEIPTKRYNYVLSRIKRIIDRYQRLQYSLLEEAASLGTIIVLTTPNDENPLRRDLDKEIKEILNKYSIGKSATLDNYLQNCNKPPYYF
jgi:hypothetical protein